MTTHHIPEERLVEYAAGACTEPAALALASHVALCDACGARVAELEAVGGEFLDAAGASELPAGALEAALARLDAPPASRQQARALPPPPAFLAAYGLPRPLVRRLAEAGAAPRWRAIVPGVRAIDLPLGAAGSTARIVAFKAGVRIPLHDHGGAEHIVVLSGAIEEAEMRFERGDIAIRQPGERHEQRIASDAPCISLVVNEGKLLPLTLRGRLLLAISRD